MMKVIFVVGWIACGIIAAGIFNASQYDKFHNCGRQGAEDQSFYMVLGLIGGPISLVAAVGESGFASSGWSLSTHSCAEPVRPVPH